MQTTNSSDVRVEERPGGALWITIDRAHKHNALSRPVLAQLRDAVLAAGQRDDLRLIVLTGAGERYFAAGGDLRDLSSVRDAAAVNEMMDEAGAALDAIRRCPLPVLAFVNGDAIGGGAELALACDLRLQAIKARVGFIQGKLAITSAWGGGPDLFRLLGPARAMRMMARCELIDADTALAWGLADAVIGDGRDGDDLAAFIGPMLACTPRVLRGIKAQAIVSRQGLDWPVQRAVEKEHLLRTWLHDDHWAAAERLLSASAK